MHARKRARRWLCVAVLIGAAGAAPAQDRLTFQGDLAATAGFMTDLAALFEAETGIAVNIEVTDATRAIRSVAGGEADLGGAARRALPGDLEAGVLLYPVAWDALVVIVHHDNPVSELGRDGLKAVLAGEITNWSELGGMDEPIRLVLTNEHAGGLEYNLRALLFEDPEATLSPSRTVPHAGAVEAAVAGDPHALGITTLAGARDRPVKRLALDGVYAGPESIRSGDYPLYLPLHLVVPTEAGAGARRFLGFAQSAPARRILRRGHTVPYMDALALIEKQFRRENRRRRADGR